MRGALVSIGAFVNRLNVMIFAGRRTGDFRSIEVEETRWSDQCCDGNKLQIYILGL